MTDTAPAWAHHLLTAFLTGAPLNFHGEHPPADILQRLDQARADGTLGAVRVRVADPEEMGRQVVQAINAYERRRPR